MPEEPPDFESILASLEAARVRCVLIGGFAMIAHGSTYVTQDIDFAYDRAETNLSGLVAAFSPLHPRLRGVPEDVPFVFDARTLKNAFNLTLETDLGAIDLLGIVAGISSFEALWERAIPMQFYGISVKVASLDDLIAMKEAANRPKDQLHLKELRALRG